MSRTDQLSKRHTVSLTLGFTYLSLALIVVGACGLVYLGLKRWRLRAHATLPYSHFRSASVASPRRLNSIRKSSRSPCPRRRPPLHEVWLAPVSREREKEVTESGRRMGVGMENGVEMERTGMGVEELKSKMDKLELGDILPLSAQLISVDITRPTLNSQKSTNSSHSMCGISLAPPLPVHLHQHQHHDCSHRERSMSSGKLESFLSPLPSSSSSPRPNSPSPSTFSSAEPGPGPKTSLRSPRPSFDAETWTISTSCSHPHTEPDTRVQSSDSDSYSLVHPTIQIQPRSNLNLPHAHAHAPSLIEGDVPPTVEPESPLRYIPGLVLSSHDTNQDYDEPEHHEHHLHGRDDYHQYQVEVAVFIAMPSPRPPPSSSTSSSSSLYYPPASSTHAEMNLGVGLWSLRRDDTCGCARDC